MCKHGSDGVKKPSIVKGRKEGVYLFKDISSKQRIFKEWWFHICCGAVHICRVKGFGSESMCTGENEISYVTSFKKEKNVHAIGV